MTAKIVDSEIPGEPAFHDMRELPRLLAGLPVGSHR